MRKRNVLNSPRLLELKKQRRRVVLNKILLSGLALAVILVLSSYLSRLNSINITSVEVAGNKIVDTGAIKKVAEMQITGKYIWLFPKTNILFYPKNKIVSALQNNFKRLKDVNLSVDRNKVLQISLSERSAKFTWCGADLPEAGAGNPKCYFTDENGYIFDEAPYFSGEVYFQLYGKEGVNIENPPGSFFLKQYFNQLLSFKNTLRPMGLKPVALYADAAGNINIFLSRGSSTTNGPVLILKSDANFQNAAENLQAALHTEPLQSKFKNKYSSLQYIDLRFGNRVYDKFK